MPKPMVALMMLLTSSFLVFSIEAQERDDTRLKPAERNRTGTLRQLIPGYYVFSSTSFNSGVIATSEGVVVLDALSSEGIARQEREAIANLIKQPVRFLVSSTFHNNYTWGNVAYQDVVKIGHENYRADLLTLMQRDRVSLENQTARLPQVTYRDRLTIHLGKCRGRIAELRTPIRTGTPGGTFQNASNAIASCQCSIGAIILLKRRLSRGVLQEIKRRKVGQL